MDEFIEIPANKNSLSKRRPVHSIGINDADYLVCAQINGKQVMCPYYQSWTSMLERCYCQKYQERYPTYTSCLVVKDWLTFSNFKLWMEKQDWQGKALDKDILIVGNKTYSPEACVFVSCKINNLLIDSAAIRGSYPQGVCWSKWANKYIARCSVDGKQKHLGYFKTTTEAEISYLEFKSRLIHSIASDDKQELTQAVRDGLIFHAELLRDKALKLKGSNQNDNHI